MNKSKKWYQYLWIWSILYFSLGFFNILFAWLGMIDFPLPYDVWQYGFSNLSGSEQSSEFKASGQTLLDFPCTVEMGLHAEITSRKP